MPRETFTKAQFWSELDALGEDEVRTRLSVAKQWGDPPGGEKYGLVLLWLKAKEDDRTSAASLRKEAREEESLSISRKALTNSRLATRIATCAIVLSIIMAIQKLIEWHLK